MTPKQAAAHIQDVRTQISKAIVWQEELVSDILIAFFAGWHVLLEWAPWLAKTKTIKTLSQVVGTSFSRIQFTPDLLPSDLIWSEIYRQASGDFQVRKWPLFANFILADEINRAPSKVQSALLEAMEEKQVTIWDETFTLEDPFVVLATQNPIEQEGTYPLSEAQIDRFLMKVKVPYPSREEEVTIIQSVTWEKEPEILTVITKEQLNEIIAVIQAIHVDEKIYDYVAGLVQETRSTSMSKYVMHWASPRASIALIRCARVRALMEDRDFVIPEDIKALAFPILRHRIIRSYDALADEITTDEIIGDVLTRVRVP